MQTYINLTKIKTESDHFKIINTDKIKELEAKKNDLQIEMSVLVERNKWVKRTLYVQGDIQGDWNEFNSFIRRNCAEVISIQIDTILGSNLKIDLTYKPYEATK